MSGSSLAQVAAENRIEPVRRALAPFIVAAETTRMPLLCADARSDGHQVVFANDSFLTLTGSERGAVLGKGLAILLAELVDHDTVTAIESALHERKDGSWAAECRRGDGGVYFATVFMSPVRDERDQVCQHFLSFVEIGDHLHRLKTERDEIHALYEQAPGFIALTHGSEHRFTFTNASYNRLVGHDSLVGRTVSEALPEVVEQGLIDLLDQVFSTGEAFVGTHMPVRLRATGSDKGSQYYLSFVYQPIRDGDGLITGIFCEGYDATREHLNSEKLSELQRQLAHTSRLDAMGTMAATLAHELNQPLTAISNCAAAAVRLVNRTRGPPTEMSAALDLIQEASIRAGDIIRSVREFTRRGEIGTCSFGLSKALSECVQIVRAAGCPEIAVAHEIPDDLLMTGDRVQIQQVVINLLRNACEADVREERHVIIEAVNRGDRVEVCVSDSGCGVPTEVANSLFDWASSSKKEGMGIGLSISRTIIEAHSGSLWLEKSDQSGSKFCFSVPLQDNISGASQ